MKECSYTRIGTKRENKGLKERKKEGGQQSERRKGGERGRHRKLMNNGSSWGCKLLDKGL